MTGINNKIHSSQAIQDIKHVKPCKFHILYAKILERDCVKLETGILLLNFKILNNYNELILDQWFSTRYCPTQNAKSPNIKINYYISVVINNKNAFFPF